MKKRIYMAITVALACMAIAACGSARVLTEKEYSEESLMKVVDSTMDYTIFANKETGVMYFCRGGKYGASVCMMVDAEGKPQVYEWE